MTLPNFKLTLRANSSTYKVYTALLSQSGGSNNQTLTSGAVTKGVTYRIGGSNGNFTNVGAPNNNDGTYFVATINETPTSYGTSQLVYNTGAPIVNVLENTIGNIYWRYDDVGVYIANGAFTLDKTIVFVSSFNNGGNHNISTNIDYINSNNIQLQTFGNSGNYPHQLDTVDPYKLAIEIRVYI